MEEVWKDIPGYEGEYQVSTLGRVKSLERWTYKGKNGCIKKVIPCTILKPLHNKKGKRFQVFLSSRKRFYVHRLVMMAFCENPDNKEMVNHKDGNAYNNCLSNLEWCSRSENANHAYHTLGAKNGKGLLVMNIDNGIFYDSISEAYKSKINNFSLGHFKEMVAGRFYNKTSFITV